MHTLLVEKKNMKPGTKDDSQKPNWSLLPLRVLEEAIKVLEHGARKYAVDNWKHVRPRSRYFSACLRHLASYQSGEKLDPESGLPHLAHAICCLVFLSYFEANE